MQESATDVVDHFTVLHAIIRDKFLAIEEDKSHYSAAPWSSTLGSGQTCVLEHGKCFEKYAVNFSSIQSSNLPDSALGGPYAKDYTHFRASGVSVIAHPVNPYVPASHMNVRVFILYKDDKVLTWWFGGGFDLTPYFVFEDDICHWHYNAMSALADFGASRYLCLIHI